MSGMDILAGTAKGAATGAMFGPWGAAAGGVIGFLGGLFGKGKSKQAEPAMALPNQIMNLASMFATPQIGANATKVV
jgi:hypothetical protein